MSLPRLRQIVLASEATETIDQLSRVLGLDAPFVDKGVAEFGLTNAVFAIGDQFLEVVVPVEDTAPAARFLQRNGPGGYMAIFQVDDIETARARTDSHGMRRVWDIDLDDISASHLHPADVSGAIVSLDEPRPGSSWRWGGPDWQRRSKIGRVSGAVLESLDPMRMMARWAAATGASGDADGLMFEDGPLMFVEGDRDGIVAFLLSLPDSEAVLARARAEGLRVDEGAFELGGVIFDLDI